MQAQAIPSFLYRLHYDFPHEEEFETKYNQRQAAIDSLVSDLNMLFSSRPLSGSLDVYDELERSILNYGVIDVVDVDILNDDRIELLRKNIYQSLVLFEPRLQDITIKLQNNSPENIVFWVQGLFWGQRIVFSVTWSSVAYSYSVFGRNNNFMLLPQKTLDYYNRELSYLRKYGVAFARRFPKIARRLGLAEGISEDPHVERLVESFAFLTARIHQKIDEDMPELNNAMMEILAPQFMRQVPSVSLVQFQPEPATSGITGVLSVPRHSFLTSKPVGDVLCRFRTVYPVEILPIDLCEASLKQDPYDRNFILTLRFITWPGAQFQAQSIRLYLHGTPVITHSLYELLLSQVDEWQCYVDQQAVVTTADSIQAIGFEEADCLCADDMAISPVHHLLRDYFSLIERFLFIELPLPKWELLSGEFHYRFRLKDCHTLRRLERNCDKVNVETFRMNCSPIVNLFPHQAEPLTLSDSESEYLIQPDARRPLSMEVYTIRSVEVFQRSKEKEHNSSIKVKALFGIEHHEERGVPSLYWQTTQRASMLPNDQGINTFIGFADLRGKRHIPAVDVVMLKIMCTNRDLAQKLSNGNSEGDFDAEFALPGVKVSGLIRPRPPLRPQLDAAQNWRMVAQLNLNHMLLEQDDSGQRLRETLELYNVQNDMAVSRLIALLSRITINPLSVRLDPADPYSFAKGLEVTLTFQPQAEEFVDFYLFCCVLERFIALYAPINGFTQVVTCLSGVAHSVKRWPRRCGRVVWL